jgi:hypothetical protein
MKPQAKDKIVLIDYDGGHTNFYGTIEKALKYFDANNDYWKVLVNGLAYMVREDFKGGTNHVSGM